MLGFFQQVQSTGGATWLGIPGMYLILLAIVAIPIIGLIITGVTALYLDYKKKVRIAEAELRLKEAMISQGRPTEEIERVIRASAQDKKVPNSAPTDLS